MDIGIWDMPSKVHFYTLAEAASALVKSVDGMRTDIDASPFTHLSYEGVNA